jgi:RND family efflux transporter MFP subunit
MARDGILDGRSLKIGLGVVIAAIVAAALVGRSLETGASASSDSIPTAEVTRGNVLVSVGGVGRVVEADSPTQLVVPGSTSTSPSGSSGSTATPGDAVFAQATGHVSAVLVAPGRQVVAGQPIAIVDDGGASVQSEAQAAGDLAAARLELEQKLRQDPLRGLPPTAAEITASQYAISSARDALSRLRKGPTHTDVTQAQSDLAKARSDLDTTLGGTPAARARAIRLARAIVAAAKSRLAVLLAPPSAADIAAAEADVKKALADKVALVTPSPAPTAEAVDAAQEAVSAAQQRYDRLTGPPDPIAVSSAQADLKKAQSDLADLQAADAAQTAIDAAKAAVDTAQKKLDRVSGPADPIDVATARADLKKARADLAALTAPRVAPSAEALASADQTVAAAQLKLDKLRAGPNPADVSAARADLQRARADLATLLSGPSPTSVAAGRAAVQAAKTKLTHVLTSPLPADVQTARLNLERAQGDLAALLARGGAAAPADLALTRDKVRAAEERLAAARRTGDALTVRAPSGGTVTAVLTRIGAPVDATTAIATVARLDHLGVDVDLSEFDVADVKPGQPARISIDALGGRKFAGRVLSAALTGTDSGGGVITYPVRVSLPHVPGVRTGMNVSVRVIVAEKRHVLQVPLEAVTHDGDEATVSLINAQGEPAPKRVKLGLANNKVVEIVSGLRAGQEVVVEQSGGEGE